LFGGLNELVGQNKLPYLRFSPLNLQQVHQGGPGPIYGVGSGVLDPFDVSIHVEYIRATGKVVESEGVQVDTVRKT